MKKYLLKIFLTLMILIPWSVILFTYLWLPLTQAQNIDEKQLSDNEEVIQMYKDDQNDRRSSGQSIDWEAVSLRDEKRLRRIKELYQESKLKTGADYFHAAMILQHGQVPEDYLLAHELSVIAAIKGEKRAKWLAAASEDRFLMYINRPQRFGTQYKGEAKSSKLKLYTIDKEVTDDLRREMNVPSLAQAKEKEAELNKEN